MSQELFLHIESLFWGKKLNKRLTTVEMLISAIDFIITLNQIAQGNIWRWLDQDLTIQPNIPVCQGPWLMDFIGIVTLLLITIRFRLLYSRKLKKQIIQYEN